jgi:hypothetical protein
MSQHSDFEALGMAANGTPERHEDQFDQRPAAKPADVPIESAGETVDHDQEGTWHSEAGRKGAHRIHQLIEEGRLYEKEHGLKRGRQRLRQLIELGKLYEREHGLRPEQPRRSRRLSRMSKQQALANFLQSVVRLAKPSLREELQRLLRSIEDQAA